MAQLVARGFEVHEHFQADLPTNIKSTLPIGNKEWYPKTTDIKPAFLQRLSVENSVNLVPLKKCF